MDLTSQQKILHSLSPELAFFLEKMREMGQERNIPNISWNTAAFLQETLQSRKITSILEIGPANGFSTMILALACPEAHITSIECSRHAFEELRANLQSFHSLKNTIKTSFLKGDENIAEIEGDFWDNKSSVSRQARDTSFKKEVLPADLWPKVTSDINQEKIGNFSLYYGDARAVLPAFLEGARELVCPHPESILREILEQRFDCIFIDGAFRMTREFFDLSLPLLTPGGIIILDDAIKYRWKMEGFHEYLDEQGITYELIQTDEDDGVMVILN